MQTLFLAACPFCALARILADIFCLREQRLRNNLRWLVRAIGADGRASGVGPNLASTGASPPRVATAVVIEAKLQGIAPFCLTVDRHAASYLPALFGTHRYALLTQPAMLPAVLLDCMQRLVRA